MTSLHVTRWGEGTPAVFVHGSLVHGTGDFFAQKPLGDHGYELLIIDRRGYGGSPTIDGEDFLRDADDVAALLVELAPGGAHVVGNSYGAIASMYAANLQPDLVRSLTLLEPPAFGIVEHPAAVDTMNALDDLWDDQTLDDRDFVLRFVAGIGEDPDALPGPVLDALQGNVPVVRAARRAWDADPPLTELARHDLHCMVVSGAHHPAFDAVCEHVAIRLHARREVLPGAGHEIATLGEPFNAVLLRFWREVDRTPPPDDYIPLT